MVPAAPPKSMKRPGVDLRHLQIAHDESVLAPGGSQGVDRLGRTLAQRSSSTIMTFMRTPR